MLKYCRHCEIPFLIESQCIFNSNDTEICSQWFDWTNPHIGSIIDGRRLGDKPLPEPIMTQFTVPNTYLLTSKN